MGTDWVSLFNNQLCDEILGMSLTRMVALIESRLSHLKWTSEFILGFDAHDSASLRFQELELRGRTQEELKADLVESLCLSSAKSRSVFTRAMFTWCWGPHPAESRFDFG